MEGKFRAVVEEIAERHKKGQPVLVGTVAVETSELISRNVEKERHSASSVECEKS